MKANRVYSFLMTFVLGVFLLSACSTGTPQKTVTSFLKAVTTGNYKAATDNLTIYSTEIFTTDNLKNMNDLKINTWEITKTSKYGQTMIPPGEDRGVTKYYAKVETVISYKNGQLSSLVFTLVQENGWKIFDIKIDGETLLDG